MDDKEYEEITAALYRALGEESGVTIEGFGAGCRIQGKSGAWHQIDVLTKQSNGLQTVRTAVECKHWKRRVPRDVVAKLIVLLEDTNIEKGVVVSKEGFTSGATALAKERNISLVEIREPSDADWEGKIKTIIIETHITVPEFYDLEFVQPPAQIGEKVQLTTTGQGLLIEEPGKEPETLDQVLNSAANVTSSEQIEVRFPAETTMKVNGYEKRAKIEAVRFKVKWQVSTREIVIDAADAIRLIVKEVFEGRQFNVGYDGRIVEVN